MNNGMFFLEAKIKIFKKMLDFLLAFIPTNNLVVLKLSKKLDKYISKYQKLKMTKNYKHTKLAA